MWWIGHILGLDDASGPWYLFWSGICGDLSLFGAALVIVRKHNCHVKSCPRIGRHPVEGTTYVVCRHHHPDEAPTAYDLGKCGAAG